ncbi:MAG: transcriptional repressor [Candidatus Omnitrophica bacterium]|nr:transcriptional repressor [Candidatus Omnitrophota bacterium]
MISQIEIHNRVQFFEAACREQGYPLTLQRRTVFEELAGHTDHPTAEQLVASVQAHFPEISRATVYRVLDILVKMGVARKIAHPGGVVRFDPNTRRHHHLVCTACDSVLDISEMELDLPSLPQVSKKGFSIFDYSISFMGLCPDCRQDRKSNTNNKA